MNLKRSSSPLEEDSIPQSKKPKTEGGFSFSFSASKAVIVKPTIQNVLDTPKTSEEGPELKKARVEKEVPSPTESLLKDVKTYTFSRPVETEPKRKEPNDLSAQEKSEQEYANFVKAIGKSEPTAPTTPASPKKGAFSASIFSLEKNSPNTQNKPKMIPDTASSAPKFQPRILQKPKTVEGPLRTPVAPTKEGKREIGPEIPPNLVKPSASVEPETKETDNYGPFREEAKVYIIEDEELAARCEHIPLRLDSEERKLLLLLEGALDVSEYTDKVDIISYNRPNFIRRELNEIVGLIQGLYIAQTGSDKNTKANTEAFVQKVFEIGRRYKVMNPDKMRTTHGKLLFLMQDAPSQLTCSFKAPIQTVQSFLKSKNLMGILKEKDLVLATRCFSSSDMENVKKENIKKNEAKARLMEKYQNQLSPKDFELVVDSIADSNSYALSHRHCIDRMIEYLHAFFNRAQPKEDRFSLAIHVGRNGSCLTHNHTTQFHFVHQSLLLWREIQHNMFRLWKAADNDLLNGGGSYKLTDTGQGLNRMQQAPTVYRIMQEILGKVKSRLNNQWVGLSVVHLGDKDVPNALVFINKYCQVPFILAPIINTLDKIKSMAKSDPAVKIFVEQFGSVKGVQNAILCDFFKHGFDGSGDSGGSCIDGRLTSAWNWCSKIEKKSYYPLFMLTGFLGFDGSFRR